MSSANSIVATPAIGARFFVCRAVGTIYSADGSAYTGITAPAAGQVARDMGKTVRTLVTSLTGVTVQRVLRKVALINNRTAVVNGLASNFINFNEGTDATAVFYIDLYAGNWVSGGI